MITKNEISVCADCGTRKLENIREYHILLLGVEKLHLENEGKISFIINAESAMKIGMTHVVKACYEIKENMDIIKYHILFNCIKKGCLEKAALFYFEKHTLFNCIEITWKQMGRDVLEYRLMYESIKTCFLCAQM